MRLSLLPFLLPFSSFAAHVHHRFRNNPTSKPVFVHFMVGNTYPYSIESWINDIMLASSKNFDAFVLNIGKDPWQVDKVADAYQAAKICSERGTHFDLLISFDMTSLPCAQPEDANTLQYFINTYHSHPNHFIYENKPLFSTFAGDSCTFGMSGPDAGWQYAMKSGPPVYFVPAFFMLDSFPSVVDGLFNWNGGWPVGNDDITFNSDRAYLSKLGSKSYMAAASPWFFTHYSPQSYNKNFIYRGDDWLIMSRLESLVQNRDVVDMAQVISWNDYGESHYVGPIEGSQPNSQAWTDGFDHQGWLDLISYYITAFKTGSYPSIKSDQIFLWARLYPAAANAPDSVGRPTNWEDTQDYLWAAVFLTSPANVILACGPSSRTFSASQGVSKLKIPLSTNTSCAVNALIRRKGRRDFIFTPSGFNFNSQPPSYNFNAFVAASR